MPIYSWKIDFVLKSGGHLTAYIKSDYSNSRDVAKYLINSPSCSFIEFHNASENKHIFVRMCDVSVFSISEPDN